MKKNKKEEKLLKEVVKIQDKIKELKEKKVKIAEELFKNADKKSKQRNMVQHK